MPKYRTENIYYLPISHEAVGTYSLTRGVELFLVGSEMFFKSMKIPVSLQWKAWWHVSQQCWIQALSSTTIWLTLVKSIPLFGGLNSQKLNLGTETNNLCGPPSCETLWSFTMKLGRREEERHKEDNFKSLNRPTF